jgi:hypothetical protein
MWTANGVVFVDDVASERLQALSHLLLNLERTERDADVAGVI